MSAKTALPDLPAGIPESSLSSDTLLAGLEGGRCEPCHRLLRGRGGGLLRRGGWGLDCLREARRMEARRMEARRSEARRSEAGLGGRTIS